MRRLAHTLSRLWLVSLIFIPRSSMPCVPFVIRSRVIVAPPEKVRLAERGRYSFPFSLEARERGRCRSASTGDDPL